jgi:hypothetical protein
MRQCIAACLLLLFLLILPNEPAHADDRQVLFHEDFANLDNWKPFTFPRIKKHTVYSIEKEGDRHVLKTESNASASAIVYKESFNVYEYRMLRWRWKVGNVYRKGDATLPAGDDFPLRIDIMFEYEPKKAGFRESITHGLARAVYGGDPPISSLNYVWANKEHPKRIMTCPSLDHVRYILLRKGPALVGTWQDEKVDIVADYREAFRADPPAKARIAIMNDSDNTGESSVSWIEYIEVLP